MMIARDLTYDDQNVTWKYNESKININLKEVRSAFVDTQNFYVFMYVGKIKKFLSDKILFYDFLGNLIMDCNRKEEYLWWKLSEKEHRINIKNLMSVFFAQTKKIIIIWYKYNNLDKVIALDLYGEYLYDITIPNGFTVWYFSETDMDIHIACDGGKRHADSYGRTSYWFLIDLKTGRLTKQGLAY
ncbi:hypothetical protein [Fusobacterium sp. PH5-44]|uniref:hypothetical protein n=1 Tax=unclassified Fusobacterium TaxID=2648384 RepID=UPI003D24D076